MKTLTKLTALIFTSSIMFMSCNKDTTCIAKIKCKDANGNLINRADVKLFATVENENHSKFRADMQASGETGSDGEVAFTFKLPAIYDVNVTLLEPKQLLVLLN